jgi:hypothetical protein
MDASTTSRDADACYSPPPARSLRPERWHRQRARLRPGASGSVSAPAPTRAPRSTPGSTRPRTCLAHLAPWYSFATLAGPSEPCLATSPDVKYVTPVMSGRGAQHPGPKKLYGADAGTRCLWVRMAEANSWWPARRAAEDRPRSEPDARSCSGRGSGVDPDRLSGPRATWHWCYPCSRDGAQPSMDWPGYLTGQQLPLGHTRRALQRTRDRGGNCVGRARFSGVRDDTPGVRLTSRGSAGCDLRPSHRRYQSASLRPTAPHQASPQWSRARLADVSLSDAHGTPPERVNERRWALSTGSFGTVRATTSVRRRAGSIPDVGRVHRARMLGTSDDCRLGRRRGATPRVAHYRYAR